MPVIAVVNQKGGTGKTTLATNLAWVFAETRSVLLIDADPQASAQNWAAANVPRPDNLVVGSITASDLARQVRDDRPLYDLVIIDGPPGISKISADAVRSADLVLIPSKPSPLDVWAASDIVAAIQARQKSAGGLPRAAFVITMSQPRTRLGRNIDEALSDLGVPVLRARTTQRVAYPTAVNDGNAVVVGSDQTARNEMLAIRGEVELMLNDQHKR